MSKKYFLYFVKLYDIYNSGIRFSELNYLMLFAHSFSLLSNLDFATVYNVLNLDYDAEYRADCLYKMSLHNVF